MSLHLINMVHRLFLFSDLTVNLDFCEHKTNTYSESFALAYLSS